MKYKENLKNFALAFGVESIASVVIDNPKFEIWSGSGKPDQHHYGKGGLCRHTCEVVNLCLTINSLMQLNLDPIELYFSGLFHDYGKIWDYEPIDESYTEWRGTDHKRTINHVSRSALEWNLIIHDVANKNSNYISFRDKYTDIVLHNILAHHGQRSWGSPIMPKSKAAWLLHLCDGISARMDDADKLDLIKKG